MGLSGLDIALICT